MDLLDDDGLLDIRRRGSRTDPRAAIEELQREHEDTPARNSALTDWAANLGQRPTKDGAGCHLCDAPGRNHCNQCGRSACSADYWVMYGLCRACANEDRVRGVHRAPEPEESNWLGEA